MPVRGAEPFLLLEGVTAAQCEHFLARGPPGYDPCEGLAREERALRPAWGRRAAAETQAGGHAAADPSDNPPMSGPAVRPSMKKTSGMRIGIEAWSPEVYPNWMVSSSGTAPSEVSRKAETVAVPGAPSVGAWVPARG